MPRTSLVPRETPSDSGRISTLDYWRHLAAAAVVFSHAYVLSGASTTEPFYRLTDRLDAAAVAVDFFFCLSGFLMYGALRRNPNPARFIHNRLARLLPGLVVCVLSMTFVVGPLLSSIEATTYFSSPDTWRYLQNGIFLFRPALPGVFTENPYPHVVNGSLWTLAYEMVCYVGVILTIALSTGKRTSLSLAVATICVGFLALSSLVEPNRYANMARLLFFFSIGNAAAHSRHIRYGIATALVFVLVASLLNNPIVYRMVPHAAVALFCIACLHSAPWLAPRLKPLPFDYSFGLYIYSFPIQQILAGWLTRADPMYFFIISLLFTLPVAALSWHLIEQPSLRRAQRRVRREGTHAAICST